MHFDPPFTSVPNARKFDIEADYGKYRTCWNPSETALHALTTAKIETHCHIQLNKHRGIDYFCT